MVQIYGVITTRVKSILQCGNICYNCNINECILGGL